MKAWIIIFISSEFVINIACQSEFKYHNNDEESFGNVGNFDGPEFQALFPDSVGITAETYIEETKDDNRRNFKIVPEESESSIDGVQPYVSDFSYEYELVKDDVKPFFGDLSIEDSHESIDDDEDDDESTKSGRHKRDQSAGPDEFDTAYEDFVHKNFGNYNAEAQVKPAAAPVSSEDDEHDYDEATDDNDDEYERGKRLSEEQAAEDRKNSKYCKIKYKGERECSVCKNPKTGEESESCSYSSNPAPKGYSFKHKKNFDKYKNDDDENDDNNDHADDSSDDDDDGDNGGEHHQPKQLHPTQFHPKNSSPQPIPYHRYKPSGSYKENYPPKEAHYNQQKYKHDDHSDGDHDDHDDYDEDDHAKESAEDNQDHDHSHPSQHRDHSHPSHHQDHSHPPHYSSHHEKSRKPIKHHKPSKKPKKHNHYHSPSAEYYFDQIYHSTSPLVTKTSGVDRVLEELKNRDWSKCKKTFKNGFTCYLCEGKNGESDEECMSFGDEDSQSTPLSSSSQHEFNDRDNNDSNMKNFAKKEIENKTKSKVKTKLIETTKKPNKTADKSQIKSASKRSFVITKAPKPEDETDETGKRTIKRMVSFKIHEDATDTGPKKFFYQKTNIF